MNIEERISEIKEFVGDKKAVCGLSGGVDSSVAAVLVHKAIGDNLTCIFVDNGLLRLNERKEVEEVFTNQFHMNLIVVDGEERFLNKLKGVTDPEEKRKIIGEEFIRIFEEEAEKIQDAKVLVQGTIKSDIIESVDEEGKLAVKSHHNVGGLPEDVDFEILEPLKDLFKDGVRDLGRELNIPDKIVDRQPFPGPGLGIRILGEVNKEKADILRKADYIFREEIEKSELDIFQYFAVLPNIQSVGVINGERSYLHTIALRAINSRDAMEGAWAHIPLEMLEKISNRITNEVDEVNRVVYDITSKPPATIEWE